MILSFSCLRQSSQQLFERRFERVFSLGSIFTLLVNDGPSVLAFERSVVIVAGGPLEEIRNFREVEIVLDEHSPEKFVLIVVPHKVLMIRLFVYSTHIEFINDGSTTKAIYKSCLLIG